MKDRTMKVLICGNRKLSWNNLAHMQNIVLSYKPTEIIVGNAKGADSIGAFIAEKYGIPCTMIKADWDTYGKQAGVVRNLKMLALRPDVILAFNATGKGTQHMVKIGRDAGIKTVIYEGSLDE